MDSLWTAGPQLPPPGRSLTVSTKEKFEEPAGKRTPQEKVTCFEQLPKRIYAGWANGRVRYFDIKIPIAVEQDWAVFTYIESGMGTPTELRS